MKDLKDIPERFHILFTTDWNMGSKSKMNSLQRGDLSDLFLEYNRWSIKESIRKNRPQEPETIVGFED